MEKKFIKVDKNGTKYWEIPTCRKCGGQGGSESWRYTGYTCYRCGGSGLDPKPEIYKEYTPEYAEKLAEQRQKRAEKKYQEQLTKVPQLKTEWLKKNGFNAEGKTYVFLGNTYDIKEQIKEVGGKFDNWIYWHIANPVDGFEFIEVSIDEVADENIWEGYEYNSEKCNDLKDRKKREENKDKVDAGYYGEVGDKITVDLTYVNHAAWDNNFGYYGGVTILYIFKDTEGHIFTWKTSKYLDCIDNKEESFTLTGTIKDHNEYNGQKQTVLTRCKVA